MERVCWVPLIAPAKPSETGVLVGGRGNAVAARAGSGAYIVPLSRGSCNTMTGTAWQRGTQDVQKFPGHRWSGWRGLGFSDRLF